MSHNLLVKLIRANRKILLVGPRGIAKTSRFDAVAAEVGRRFVVLRGSVLDRLDVSGAVFPDAASGTCRLLPLELLRDLQTTVVPTLLCLDDLGQAPIDVQNAMFRLFDRGFLSPHVLICGATNRVSDKSGAIAINSALQSRFDACYSIATPTSTESADGAIYIQPWAAELAAWRAWAFTRNAAPEVIAWHDCTGGRTLWAGINSADPAVRSPDFRAWESVIELWNADIRELSALGAAIGRPAAAEFLAFARLANEITSPTQIVMSPATAPIPKAPQALYLVCQMLAQFAEPEHARAVCVFISRLAKEIPDSNGRVYAALLANDIRARLGARVEGTPEWCSWFAENQDLFNTDSASA